MNDIYAVVYDGDDGDYAVYVNVIEALRAATALIEEGRRDANLDELTVYLLQIDGKHWERIVGDEDWSLFDEDWLGAFPASVVTLFHMSNTQEFKTRTFFESVGNKLADETPGGWVIEHDSVTGSALQYDITDGRRIVVRLCNHDDYSSAESCAKETGWRVLGWRDSTALCNIVIDGVQHKYLAHVVRFVHDLLDQGKV